MFASKSKPVRELVPLPGQEYAFAVPGYVKITPDPYGLPKTKFTAEEVEDLSKPRVLISGGGIGGLTLALLLHKARIPFLVLERAKEIKPLGSVISMGGPIGPLFRQLGIWDEFVKRGKHHKSHHIHSEDLTPAYSLDFPWLEEAIGYEEYIVSRPDLYDILFNSIPRERILLGKRVLSLIQNDDNVMVTCSDNTSYHGEILVGADGAYSAVRQNLYKALKLKSKLPSSDDVSLPFSCVCLVGQTVPLDPEVFSQVQGDLAQGHSILGTSNMCTWMTFPTNKNTVCWMVIHFLDKDSAKRHDSFRNSEWGPEATEQLAREVRVFKVPGTMNGEPMTLGEYVDRTPSDLMSKVMLEEIVFDTWYSGRTVLLGDACHKMNPSGGVGAINAIHDAVTLANWMSTLRMSNDKAILKVFKAYRAERYPVAKAAFEDSQMLTRTIGKNLLSTIFRGMIKRIPLWVWKRIVYKMNAARYQASFLPLIEDNAPCKALYQRSLYKTMAIREELAKTPTVMTAGNSAPAVV